ncbi:hypothetical protein [Paraburkholderia sp. HD33-4]|uniref:hypothetical protein n=1 Tax=Paraburkholderia sp. HD33-4 TaxID=2883242 RepID=UPI001F27D8E3|nr:hypothetical protein [Paraburkholderia sp. HD33-4]
MPTVKTGQPLANREVLSTQADVDVALAIKIDVSVANKASATETNLAFSVGIFWL